LTIAAEWIALLGYPLVALLWLRELGGSRRGLFAARLWLLCMAAGLGLGLASCTFFLRLLLGGKAALVFAILESAVLVYLIAWRIARSARRSTRPSREGALSPVLAILLAMGFAASGLAYASYTRERPHGTWDAFGIWNMRAKLLYHAPSGWMEVFREPSVMPHMDYPLLLPATVARIWRGLAADSILAPAWIGFFFTYASAAVVLATLALRGKSALGVCGALVLLASGHLASFGSAQRTDVPLGFFVLCACSLALLSSPWSLRRAPWCAAFGLALSLCAWTKNEGLIAALLLCAPMAVLVVPRMGFHSGSRAVLAFLCGAAPCAAVLVLFQLRLAPPNDLFAAGRTDELLALASDPSRYAAVVKVLWTKARIWEHGVPLCALVLAVVAVALRGKSLRTQERALLRSLTASIVLIVAAYLWVYVISPHDLDWHVETSLERLLLHIWPSSVLLALYALREPSPRSEHGASRPAVAATPGKGEATPREGISSR
jgi:hypothetical protein